MTSFVLAILQFSFPLFCSLLWLIRNVHPFSSLFLCFACSKHRSAQLLMKVTAIASSFWICHYKSTFSQWALDKSRPMYRSTLSSFERCCLRYNLVSLCAEVAVNPVRAWHVFFKCQLIRVVSLSALTIFSHLFACNKPKCSLLHTRTVERRMLLFIHRIPSPVDWPILHSQSAIPLFKPHWKILILFIKWVLRSLPCSLSPIHVELTVLHSFRKVSKHFGLGALRDW